MMRGKRLNWAFILLVLICFTPVSATIIDGIFIQGEDVITTSPLGDVSPVATPVPVSGIFLASEDVVDHYCLTAVTVPMNSVPVHQIFLSGEDVLACFDLQYNGYPYCPCCSLCPCCGPDFNGNGYVDWGDVVKLAYYYWGLIDEDTLCGW